GNQSVNTGAGRTTCDQTATWTEPTATDNCGGSLAFFSRSHAPGATFSSGTTTVTYVFKDAAGNTTNCSFDITVVDNTDPVITCPFTTPQNRNVNTGACTYTVSGTEFNATATDNCLVTSLTYVLTGATTGTGASLAGVVFNKGTTTITW